MRIVAGTYRARRLVTPADRNIRPTSERIRESLFSIISSKFPTLLKGARVLDLFAGTGALGLEAISRGAAFAMFVENSKEGQELLRENINSLNLQTRTIIKRADATQLGSIGKQELFDLAFADPPYAQGLAEKSATNLLKSGWLTPQAILIVEENIASAPQQIPGYSLVDERKFGSTAIGFFKVAAQT